MLQQPPFIHGKHCPLACLAQQLRSGERSREGLLSTRVQFPTLVRHVRRSSSIVRPLAAMVPCPSCSLTGLLLLMAEAIGAFDIYLRHRAWLLRRIQYTYQLHHLLRISADSSNIRSRGLDRIAGIVEVSLVVAEEEEAST